MPQRDNRMRAASSCLRRAFDRADGFALRHRASSVQGGALSRLSGTDARVKSVSNLREVVTACGKIQRGICAHRPRRQIKWRFRQVSDRAAGWTALNSFTTSEEKMKNSVHGAFRTLDPVPCRHIESTS